MTEDRSLEREYQVIRAHALVDMLTKADTQDLPPMKWLVNAAAGSCLHGETDDPLDHDPEATFQAWVQWLNLKPGKPYPSSLHERVVRHAGGTYQFHNRDVPVGITMLAREKTPS